jgi:hypothetical protein
MFAGEWDVRESGAKFSMKFEDGTAAIVKSNKKLSYR